MLKKRIIISVTKLRAKRVSEKLMYVLNISLSFMEALEFIKEILLEGIK